MIYPLVREMAAADAPVRVPAAVASRVLGLTEQAYYKWLKQPVSAREVEEAHLIGGGTMTSFNHYALGAVGDWLHRVVAGISPDAPGYRRIRFAPRPGGGLTEGNPAGVVVHSDRGSQFRSRKFRKALKRHNLIGSMGRVGACGDNAAMESFFSLLQKNGLAPNFSVGPKSVEVHIAPNRRLRPTRSCRTPDCLHLRHHRGVTLNRSTLRI